MSRTPGPDEQVERRAPDRPGKLPKRSWWAVLKGTVREFQADELADRAAALTYYGVLSLFPALLVLVSLLGIAGKSATQQVLDNIAKLAPSSARDIISDAVRQLQAPGGLGSIVAVVGIVVAVWSASGYIAAFIRSANVVYDMPEGRPVWKVLPIRVGVTVVLLVLTVVSALIVVFTGGLARAAGSALGIGDAALTVWSIAKWPGLVVLVMAMIAILYWAAPNVKGRGFRWVTPGSVLALVVWMIASGASRSTWRTSRRTTRRTARSCGVIVFLMWLWISNIAVLLGLEFDAELARQRAVAGGHPKDEEPYVPPRDTRAWSKKDHRRMD